MLHREFDPPEELQDTIRCFWYTRLEFGEAESNYEVMPDGYAEIIFHFGKACSISYNGVLQPMPSPFIMGLLNQPVLVRTRNCLEIIGVRCFPWTVFDLLGLPSGKDGVQLIEHPVASLQPRLEQSVKAGSIEEAVDQLKEYFLNLRLQISTSSMLFKAGKAMSEANGSIPVSKVAAAAHATVRTLERKFKQSSGYSVKDVSGLMRFEQVRNRLWHFPEASLAGLAHELGYTDQSHLSREFKRYSGLTPSVFAKNAGKGKRTVINDFVVIVLS